MECLVDYTQVQPNKKWHQGVYAILSFDFKKKFNPIKKKPHGIDINKKSSDIRLLFYKRQAKQVARLGLDPEDVLQEVYKGLIIRNEGTCPYDPKKSAFSTYVVMVMNCVVMNIVKKRKLHNDRECVGSEDDAATSNLASHYSTEEDDFLIEQVRSSFQGDLLKVFDAMMEGTKHAHIAQELGWEMKRVNLCVKEIRSQVASLLQRRDA